MLVWLCSLHWQRSLALAVLKLQPAWSRKFVETRGGAAVRTRSRLASPALAFHYAVSDAVVHPIRTLTNCWTCFVFRLRDICRTNQVAGSDSLTRMSREDVLSLSREQLASNGAALATRRPQRAPKDSTFSRFLAGDTSGAACNDQNTRGPVGLIDPGFFGADASGKTDSSDAFEGAVAELLRRNTSGHAMGGDIADLGGATIDLMGGDYLLSRPIVIPHGRRRVARACLFKLHRALPHGRCGALCRIWKLSDCAWHLASRTRFSNLPGPILDRNF